VTLPFLMVGCESDDLALFLSHILSIQPDICGCSLGIADFHCSLSCHYLGLASCYLIHTFIGLQQNARPPTGHPYCISKVFS
jgi:hypothetical protein